MSNSEVSDGKIHILYLVKNAPGVSYNMLMNKCLESLYLDFFNFSRCYDELIKGNLISKEISDTGTGEVIGSNELLKITRGGLAILEDVEGTLNLQTLGYLKKASDELNILLNETNAVKAFSEPTDDKKFLVTLTSTLKGEEFSASFKVDSSEKAESIMQAWRKSASKCIDTFVADLLKM
ncbi:MAG: DUF4364 family protein [Saccharofermentans sp.]|nr:DUF4364 family protein [Saccharofermentans sp.]